MRSPYDVPAANECPACGGRGYTPGTMQVIKPTKDGPVTTELGYGCIQCRGIGRIVDDYDPGARRSA